MNTPALTTPETLARIRQLALTTAAPHLAHHLGWDVHRLRRTAQRFGIALSEPQEQAQPEPKESPQPAYYYEEHRPRRHRYGGITHEMSLADIAGILPGRQGRILAVLVRTLDGEPVSGKFIARSIGIRTREGLSAPVRAVNSRLRDANQPWRIAGSKGPNGGYRLVSIVDEAFTSMERAT